ncbi:hypothetical protein ACOSP7_021282 [Xanthoceras sorbifolium]
MRRVGRPRARPEANLNVNFEHGRGSEQVIDMKAESHPNPPRPLPRAPERRDEIIDRITQILTTIVQHQTHVPEITIERARRVRATSFDGSGDPNSAHAWLNDLERVFGVIGCSNEQKFSFATFLLKDRAYDWWLSVQWQNPIAVSWNEFKRLFNDHFYPSFYHNLKMNELYRLVQGRWIELIKDYDCTIEYHLRKANVVADALSRKTSSSIAHLKMMHSPLLTELRSLRVGLATDNSGALLATFQVGPILIDQIREL